MRALSIRPECHIVRFGRVRKTRCTVGARMGQTAICHARSMVATTASIDQGRTFVESRGRLDGSEDLNIVVNAMANFIEGLGQRQFDFVVGAFVLGGDGHL